MHLLVDYSSDSDEEQTESNDKSSRELSQRLPVPGCLLSNLKKEEVLDDPSKNEGRIRSFPHQRGNWASHVFIPCDDEEGMRVLCERVIEACSDCELKQVTGAHVSVTRTFVLLYHWIQDFVSSLSTSLSLLHSFRLELRDIDVYVNDEGTRTFLGLNVASGRDSLTEVVRILDSCLHQYKLQPFYEESRFHMSVCWCVGDKKEYFVRIMPRLKEVVASYFLDYPQASYIHVTRLLCKTGNRLYTFPLLPK